MPGHTRSAAPGNEIDQKKIKIPRKEKTMQSPYEIKKEICEMGRRVYENGFVAANDGNISVKVNDNEFYCTPTGVSPT